MSSRDAARVVVQELGDWIVVMEWPDDVDNGGPGRLLIEPSDPNSHPVGGLSSTVLRQIDFRKATERFRGQIAETKKLGVSPHRNEQDRAERLRDALNQGVSKDYLVLLSSAYVSAVNRGQSKPNDYLAELVGKTTSTVRGHLWHARKWGLLTGSPGRVGGQLTPEASEILDRIVPDAPEQPS